MAKTLPVLQLKTPLYTKPNLFIKYKKLRNLGSGGFGAVYLCQNIQKNQFVAIKELHPEENVSLDKEKGGIASTTLREISTLKSLQHENLVRLFEIVYENSNIYMIFEYVSWDLSKYVSRASNHDKLTNERFRAIVFGVLKGLEYLHSNRIVHRDIKPQNILIDNNDNVKIADFGLAKAYPIPIHFMSPGIMTVWYRAPEILVDFKKYTTAIDIWSLGCVFAELHNNAPLFPGESNIDLIHRQLKLCGTPTKESCPTLVNSECFSGNFPQWRKVSFHKVCPTMNNDEIQLLDDMLHMDPTKRISAKRALQVSVFDDLHKLVKF